MATKKNFLARNAINYTLFSIMFLLTITTAQQVLSNPIPSSRTNGSLVISTGERVEVPVKGFSIIPPRDWQVYPNLPGVTLLLEAPLSKQGRKVYPRNILVLSFPDPIPIDNQTMQEFHKTLTKNFTNPARNLEKYNIYSSELINLKNGEPAILYYADFESQDQKMRQVHLLVSSDMAHFLVSFTDIRDNFENPKSVAIFQGAKESLLSIQLESSAPTRTNWLLIVFAIVALLLSIWIAIARMQRNQKFDESTLRSPENPDDDESTGSWNV